MVVANFVQEHGSCMSSVPGGVHPAYMGKEAYLPVGTKADLDAVKSRPTLVEFLEKEEMDGEESDNGIEEEYSKGDAQTGEEDTDNKNE